MTCWYVFLFSYGISILDTKNFGLEQFQITRKKCRVARDVLLCVVVSWVFDSLTNETIVGRVRFISSF